jgi:hypothetical protein
MRAFLNRPDHLTRAAREMKAWNRTVMLARDAAGTNDVVPAAQIRTSARDRTALLTAAEDGERVAGVIADAAVKLRP